MIYEQGLPSSLVSVSSVYADALPSSALPITVTTPAPTVVRSGQFTPKAASALVDIDISHEFFEPAGANARWYLYTGPTGQGQLTPTVAVGAGAPINPTVPGASFVSLGSISSPEGNLHAALLLTGLTPGTPVRWELSVSVVGGFYRIGPRVQALAGTPNSISFASALSSYPDLGWWGAMRFKDLGTVQLIKAQHAVGYQDTLVGAPINAGGAANTQGHVAMTPDGTKCVVTNDTNQLVGVISTGNLSGAAPAVQGTYTPPGVTPDPHAVAIDPTGTYAWIGLRALGQIVRMTIATGAFGAAINVGNAGDPNLSGQSAVIVSPDGAFVYVFCVFAGTVVKVNANTGAVVSTLPLPVAANVGVISPDGANVYALAPTKIYQVRTSDMTIQASANLVVPPNGAAILPDGRSLLYGSTTAGGGNEIQEINLPALTQLAYWKNPDGAGGETRADDLTTQPNGAIYATDLTNKGLNLWPGGRVQFDTLAPYWPAELRIRVTPAA